MADEERVPGLGEEASVGEDVSVPVVGGLLEEDVDVMRLVAQPREEGLSCVERPPVDIGLTEGQQVKERLMEREQIAALDHRAEEGRRSGSRCAPQREHRHRRKVSLNAGWQSSGLDRRQ